LIEFTRSQSQSEHIRKAQQLNSLLEEIRPAVANTEPVRDHFRWEEESSPIIIILGGFFFVCGCLLVLFWLIGSLILAMMKLKRD